MGFAGPSGRPLMGSAPRSTSTAHVHGPRALSSHQDTCSHRSPADSAPCTRAANIPAETSAQCTPRDFLAAWWRGDAGPVPCGGCSACCYYDGIPVDKKRDRRRLPHLLAERNADGGLVLQRRADGACAHLGGAGLYGLRAPAIGLPHLRLPRLRRDRPCRALRPQSRNAGLGVREELGRGHLHPVELIRAARTPRSTSLNIIALLIKVQ